MKTTFTKTILCVFILTTSIFHAHDLILNKTLLRSHSSFQGRTNWENLQKSNKANWENLQKSNKANWKNLFNGENLSGWHAYNSTEPLMWSAKDGVLFTLGNNGDIVTDSEYENFDLEVEWKINEGGNSGIFYFVQEKKEYKYIWETGPEFQIIDEMNYPIVILEKQRTGACSDVLPPTILASNPAGEWNNTKITVDNGNVEHWLNGELVLRYSMDSRLWETAFKESKFSDYDYAKVRKGKIGFQDHGDPVYFRKIRIREL